MAQEAQLVVLGTVTERCPGAGDLGRRGSTLTGHSRFCMLGYRGWGASVVEAGTVGI
jgi:hypothetical protein